MAMILNAGLQLDEVDIRGRVGSDEMPVEFCISVINAIVVSVDVVAQPALARVVQRVARPFIGRSIGSVYMLARIITLKLSDFYENLNY
jgi:hypothetical protein